VYGSDHSLRRDCRVKERPKYHRIARIWVVVNCLWLNVVLFKYLHLLDAVSNMLEIYFSLASSVEYLTILVTLANVALVITEPQVPICLRVFHVEVFEILFLHFVIENEVLIIKLTVKYETCIISFHGGIFLVNLLVN